MRNIVWTWPSTTKEHSAMVGRTLGDPNFEEYEDAFSRLNQLRRRYESIMLFTRFGSAF